MRREQVTAIVLCGGSGARLGHEDKTLTPLAGRPLVTYAIAAVEPQVGRVILSCGREAERYLELGYPTVTDDQTGQGPLGGLVSALPQVETDWILTYPGDTPFARADLVARLAPAAEASGIAVPSTGDQRQHLVLLLSQARAQALLPFYASGGRAMRVWLDQEGVASVDMSDARDSFLNVNTPADRERAQERLREVR